jgi:16S rRNA (guanine527-N7)-methyltransferase
LTELTDDISRQLQTFKDELLRANAKMNLVSRQNSATVIDRLIADSLMIADYIRSEPGTKLLDIGSGAGFPWIPVKIVHCELMIVSVDANRRKIEFQRSVARLLNLEQCEFFPERVESIPQQQADVAVAKAVSDLGSLLNMAAPHVKAGGMLILPRSAREEPVEESPDSGWKFVQKKPYKTAFTQDAGKLLIFRKL